MKFNSFCQTDIGLCRKKNEDCAYIGTTPFFKFMIICDGIGGNRKGEVASQMCVNKIKLYLENFAEKDLRNEKSILKFVKRAVKEANIAIYSLGYRNASYAGMGTTLTLCLIFDDVTYICSIGDSRLYIIDDKDNLELLTRDDNLENLLIDRKQSLDSLTEFERKSLVSAVGIIQGLTFNISLISNNYKKIMLCSDGLYNMVSEEEMTLFLLNDKINTDEKVKKLIDCANMHGGQDNIGIALLEVIQNGN